jgi:hypothetical protein
VGRPAITRATPPFRRAEYYSVSNPDWFLAEPGLVKLGDGLVGVESVLKHADYGGNSLSIHRCHVVQIAFQDSLKFGGVLRSLKRREGSRARLDVTEYS